MNVEVNRGPATIDTEGTWINSGKTYRSGSSTPIWTVTVEIGVGNLTLAVE